MAKMRHPEEMVKMIVQQKLQEIIDLVYIQPEVGQLKVTGFEGEAPGEFVVTVEHQGLVERLK